MTRYIAELINTLTNLTYSTPPCPKPAPSDLKSCQIRILTLNLVLYAIHGIYKNWGRKDAFLRNIPYLGIMGVGFGSALFHATNKYYTQWGSSISHIQKNT